MSGGEEEGDSTTTTQPDASEETENVYKSFLQALIDREKPNGDTQALFDILDKQLSA